MLSKKIEDFASWVPPCPACQVCFHILASRAKPSNQKGDTMTTTYTSYDQLPLALCADDVAAVLGISRANAYTLMHSKDFPTITIGKRMIVPKDKLLAWMEERMSA